MNDRLHATSHDERQRDTYARMSRQIAEAFGYLPDDKAAAEIAEHINQFWSRSMRRDLRQFFTAQSPELDVRVRRAWEAIRFPKA